MPLFGSPNVEKLKAKRDVKGLTDALQSKKDADLRRNAALALGEIGGVQAVQPLLAAMLDAEPLVRSGAIEALGNIGDARAVNPVMQALKDRDVSVNKAAINALARIGIPSIAPLISSMNRFEPKERFGAVEALVKIRSPSINPLVGLLKEGNVYSREAAARALEALNWHPTSNYQRALFAVAKKRWAEATTLGFSAFDPLKMTLNDPQSTRQDREAAENALTKIGASTHQPPNAIDSRKSNESKPLTDNERALVLVASKNWNDAIKLGAPAVHPLAEVMNNKRSLIQDRDSALNALAEIGARGNAQAIGLLIEALKGSDGALSLSAIDAFKKVGSPAVPSLIEALNDGDVDVRFRAEKALSGIRLKPADEAQYAAFVVASGRWSEAVKLGPIAIVPIIERISGTNSPKYVWDAAFKALGAIVAKPEWKNSEFYAIETNSPSIVPLIKRVIANNNMSEDTLNVTLKALGMIDLKVDAKHSELYAGEVFTSIESSKDPDNRTAAQHLGRIAGSVLAPLVEIRLANALRHRNLLVRHRVAKILWDIGWQPRDSQEAVLIAIYCDNRQIAVRLGKEAVVPLCALLQSDIWYQDIREVLFALQEIADPRALGPLTQFLKKDQDPEWALEGKGYALNAIEETLGKNAGDANLFDLAEISKLDDYIYFLNTNITGDYGATHIDIYKSGQVFDIELTDSDGRVRRVPATRSNLSCRDAKARATHELERRKSR